MHRKIFIWSEPLPGGDWAGYATGEDGAMIAQHLCSNLLWVRADMGLTTRRKHKLYEEHFPEGYELIDLVDLTGEELDKHEELNLAFGRATHNDPN
jgi:hypothetical protein